MSRAVYSKVFFGGNVTASGVTTMYTVPTGYIAVVRDIDVCRNDSGAQRSTFDAEDDAGGFIHWLTSTQYAVFTWRGRQVFVAGSRFGVYQSGGDWTYRVSGYLLTA